ncbi:hypothetical protein SAMN05421640_1098 [Ekhidna lutea]|uniref:Chemotaxis protein CheY-P-specific phosphatase CheC n=1 Tax=Ekhidna lutea TaxID=447679 RepID=A0A239H1T2_EKHLU|nr:hypothetical protein [Ekhidna lutea]SNS75085.1 hypothetical protein SAMN05421640_1098 [Ekhidna lutea]
MIADLNDSEMKVATKLIFDGLSMAKASMEQILQSPVSIEQIDYVNAELETSRFGGANQDVHLIKTELMGELKGTSHLIFSEKEVSKLYEACLPEKIVKDDSKESMIMKLGFLTEIDNMVSAAVITEFSNFLGVEIYGNVPSLKVLKATELNDFIDKESSEFESMIHFKAVLHGKELDICPDFIWVFHNKFVDKIKDLV